MVLFWKFPAIPEAFVGKFKTCDHMEAKEVSGATNNFILGQQKSTEIAFIAPIYCIKGGAEVEMGCTAACGQKEELEGRSTNSMHLNAILHVC